MKPTITDALLDEILKNYQKPSDLTGPDDLLTELKKRIVNGHRETQACLLRLNQESHAKARSSEEEGGLH